MRIPRAIIEPARTWLRHSPSRAAQAARTARRRAIAWSARRSDGDVAAYMERIVRQATSGEVGHGLEPGRTRVRAGRQQERANTQGGR